MLRWWKSSARYLYVAIAKSIKRINFPVADSTSSSCPKVSRFPAPNERITVSDRSEGEKGYPFSRVTLLYTAEQRARSLGKDQGCKRGTEKLTMFSGVGRCQGRRTPVLEERNGRTAYRQRGIEHRETSVFDIPRSPTRMDRSSQQRREFPCSRDEGETVRRYFDGGNGGEWLRAGFSRCQQTQIGPHVRQARILYCQPLAALV